MDQDLIFVIIMACAGLSAALTAIYMILSHLRWRVEQKGKGGVGLTELQGLFEQAAREANAGLEDRLEAIEARLDGLSAAEHAPLLDELDDLPEPEKTVGRASRTRTGS